MEIVIQENSHWGFDFLLQSVCQISKMSWIILYGEVSVVEKRYFVNKTGSLFILPDMEDM